MADIKWSAFSTTATSTSGDTLVGLHSGNNYQFGLSPIPSAKGLTIWDANSNLSANNFLSGYEPITTAAGSTSLLVSSPFITQFVGSTTQTCLMPVVTGLALGQSYLIVNSSTGVVTVQSSGGNTIQAMASGTSLLLYCSLLTGTTASSWTVVNYTTSGGNVSPGLINQLAWYAASGNVVSGLATAANGVLITSAGGAPSISSTLPSAVQTNITALGIINQNLTLSPAAPAATRYILLNTDNTYTGQFIIQAGGGSASFGGGLVMYGASHATRPGWVTAGLSSAGSNFFTVNTTGTGVGSDVFTVSSVGNVVANGSITVSQTAGIIGTTTNNNASAGSVGELLSGIVLVGSAVSLTTATPANITSVSLTAGDWDVWGEVWTAPDAGTITSKVVAAITATSATLPTIPAIGTSLQVLTGITSAAGESITLGANTTRISLSGTTTIYLVASVSFSVSTMGGYGAIYARRVR